MRFGSLSARVAAAAAAAVIVATAGMGAIVQVAVSSSLDDERDAALRARAADVARLAVTAPALVTRPGALDSSVGTRSLLVQVEDRSGRIVARSSALGARLLRPPEAAPGRVGLTTVRFGDGTVRLLSAPVPESAGEASGGRLLVAVPTEGDERTLDAVRAGLLGGAAAAAVLGALVAIPLTRRALRPLRRLAGAARGIERSADPSGRLPVPATGDEAERLAGALNEMLAALEAARERERRFVADAAHELRTPITALRGNASHAVAHPDPEVLRDLEDDVARLGRLVDDLLALAREDSARRPTEALRLDEVARSVVAQRPRASLARADAAVVRGDEAALGRAIANLIENAERHGPAGGAVTVEVGVDGAGATVRVRDEGPGIPPGARERAFARFWRAPGAQAPGSGLGLAIVRATAERHGGTASADGPWIEIRLPRAAATSEQPQKAAVDMEGTDRPPTEEPK